MTPETLAENDVTAGEPSQCLGIGLIKSQLLHATALEQFIDGSLLSTFIIQPNLKKIERDTRPFKR